MTTDRSKEAIFRVGNKTIYGRDLLRIGVTDVEAYQLGDELFALPSFQPYVEKTVRLIEQDENIEPDVIAKKVREFFMEWLDDPASQDDQRRMKGLFDEIMVQKFRKEAEIAGLEVKRFC